MTEPTIPATPDPSPQAEGSTPSMFERYGVVFVGCVMALFVLEMTALVLLLQQGVNFGPMVQWLHANLGWDASGVLDAAGPIAIAYAITRLLKPFQLALAAVITPVVARALGR